MRLNIFIIAIVFTTKLMAMNPLEAPMQRLESYLAGDEFQQVGARKALEKVFAVIKEYGIDGNSVFTSKGYSLLYVAVKINDPRLAQMAVTNIHIDVNIRNSPGVSEGRTALMGAAVHGSLLMCRELVKMNADPAIRSIHGATAFQLAPERSKRKAFLEGIQEGEESICSGSLKGTTLDCKTLLSAIDEYTQNGDILRLPHLLEHLVSLGELENELKQAGFKSRDTPLEYAIVNHRFAAATMILKEMITEKITLTDMQTQNISGFLARHFSKSPDQIIPTAREFFSIFKAFETWKMASLCVFSPLSREIVVMISKLVTELKIKDATDAPWTNNKVKRRFRSAAKKCLNKLGL